MENINKINAIVAEINAVNADENLTLEEKEARMKDLMVDLDNVASNACAEVGIDYNEVKENALKGNPEARKIVNKILSDAKVQESMDRIRKVVDEIPVFHRRRKPNIFKRMATVVVERLNCFCSAKPEDKFAVALPILLGGAYILMRRKADQKALAAVGASYLAQEGTKWVIKGFEELEALNDKARKELVEMQAAAEA